MASMGSQRSTPQMIPTPGFVNSATNNNSGGFSAEPTLVPQSQQQQNSHMLSNQMTVGHRPDMQPKPVGVASNCVNGGVGVNEKSVGTGNSSKVIEQSVDNFPQSGNQGNFSLFFFCPDYLMSYVWSFLVVWQL